VDYVSFGYEGQMIFSFLASWLHWLDALSGMDVIGIIAILIVLALLSEPLTGASTFIYKHFSRWKYLHDNPLPPQRLQDIKSQHLQHVEVEEQRLALHHTIQTAHITTETNRGLADVAYQSTTDPVRLAHAITDAAIQRGVDMQLSQDLIAETVRQVLQLELKDKLTKLDLYKLQEEARIQIESRVKAQELANELRKRFGQDTPR
jgi:hypothetical protein